MFLKGLFHVCFLKYSVALILNNVQIVQSLEFLKVPIKQFDPWFYYINKIFFFSLVTHV